MIDADTSQISPTAHYTSYVWYVNGISHPAYRTRLGQILYLLLQPFNVIYRTVTKRADVNLTLLARHRMIDYFLDTAIQSGKVGQVIEIASGLSSRGMRFSKRYPNLVYVEGDLEDMVKTKLSLLGGSKLGSSNHHIVILNALKEDGQGSIFEAADRLLDKSVGCAIITEGLIGYFSTEVLEQMWSRFSRCLSQFPEGTYLADIFLSRDIPIPMLWFAKVLGWFVKGSIYLHYGNTSECIDRLRKSGFSVATLHNPSSFTHLGFIEKRRVYPCRIIDACTGNECH